LFLVNEMAKTTAKKSIKKSVKKAIARPTEKASQECTNCCSIHHAPFAGVIFILAILWILQEFEILAWNLPWLPIIIGLVALGGLTARNK